MEREEGYKKRIQKYIDQARVLEKKIVALTIEVKKKDAKIENLEYELAIR